jgi:hypothetical protein
MAIARSDKFLLLSTIALLVLPAGFGSKDTCQTKKSCKDKETWYNSSAIPQNAGPVFNDAHFHGPVMFFDSRRFIVAVPDKEKLKVNNQS